MTDEDKISELTARANKQDGKIKTLAEAVLALSQSSLHHSQMMENFFRGINELREGIAQLKEHQADTDVKLAALVDAQIRAEDEMKNLRTELREGMKEVRDVIKEMAKAVIGTNKRIDDLEK